MGYISVQEGIKSKAKRKANAQENYHPQHTDTGYIKFIELQQVFSINEVHGQNENHPEVYVLFTVGSQHVFGDCIQECLDKAIAIAGGFLIIEKSRRF